MTVHGAPYPSGPSPRPNKKKETPRIGDISFSKIYRWASPVPPTIDFISISLKRETKPGKSYLKTYKIVVFCAFLLIIF
jgi:hypothetical protein